jgi:hypothetical protein
MGEALKITHTVQYSIQYTVQYLVFFMVGIKLIKKKI